MLPPTTAHRLGEAGAAEGSGRPGPSRWRGMAGDCSRTIRGDAAWGYRPPGTPWPRRRGSGGAAGGRAPQRGGAVHRLDGTQGWRRGPLPFPLRRQGGARPPPGQSDDGESRGWGRFTRGDAAWHCRSPLGGPRPRFSGWRGVAPLSIPSVLGSRARGRPNNRGSDWGRNNTLGGDKNAIIPAATRGQQLFRGGGSF
jgi:hypothetical protein